MLNKILEFIATGICIVITLIVVWSLLSAIAKSIFGDDDDEQI